MTTKDNSELKLKIPSLCWVIDKSLVYSRCTLQKGFKVMIVNHFSSGVLKFLFKCLASDAKLQGVFLWPLIKVTQNIPDYTLPGK